MTKGHYVTFVDGGKPVREQVVTLKCKVGRCYQQAEWMKVDGGWTLLGCGRLIWHQMHWDSPERSVEELARKGIIAKLS